jgi:hypothetical protein
MHGTQKGR